VKTRIRQQLARGKRRIETRLRRAPRYDVEDRPVLGRANIRYEISSRQRGIVHGGVGVFLELAKQTGLIDAIDRRLKLLKFHAPYHESDHVLNFAFNALCDGHCLESEDVAEFAYRPTACKQTYRMIVVRKNLAVRVAQQRLFSDERYFFYITNFSDDITSAEIVFESHDRCRQENLIQQLHGGCRALRAALDTLEANGASMLMTALAWNLKAWAALWLPETPGRWQEQHREQKRRLLTMEFRTFVNAFVRLPCQIVRMGRRLIYRLLGWNPQLPTFFRLAHVLRC